MSTFKRLFNIGKGKAKVASRQAGEAFGGARSSTDEGQWADDVRHRAADTAEALASAIRPADVEPVGRVDAAPPSSPAASKPPTPVSTASTAAETPKPSNPRKRRL